MTHAVLEVNDSQLLTQVIQYVTLPSQQNSKKIIQTQPNYANCIAFITCT